LGIVREASFWRLPRGGLAGAVVRSAEEEDTECAQVDRMQAGGFRSCLARGVRQRLNFVALESIRLTLCSKSCDTDHALS
jgi:hypothetical protein